MSHQNAKKGNFYVIVFCCTCVLSHHAD